MESWTGAGELMGAHGIIGRDAELARFAAVLETRQPRVVLVQGESGIGKTTLLEAMQAYAGEQRWKIVPAGRLEKLSIAANTTEDVFCRRTRELLGVAGDDCSLPPAGKEVHVRLEPSTRATHWLVAELHRRAPVLVLVDGYQATPSFHDWLQLLIIPDIKASGAAIVLVFAEREEHLGAFGSLADETITLGRLEQSTLRTVLTATNARLSPPMEEHEFETYLNALTERPDMLRSLTHVLSIAERRDAATPD